MSKLTQVGHRKRDGTRRRAVARLKPVPSVLIVCEGEGTEPAYFRAFPVTALDVEVVGAGMNTTSLVGEAARLAKEKRYDQVWCVFDKDSFTNQAFKEAISAAEGRGFHAAWSNECFELWYVLHYGYLDTGQARALYEPRLASCLGHAYVKSSRTMYTELRDLQVNAIRNAKRLHGSYRPSRPSQDNPCTTVYQLVETLNEFLR